LPIEPSEILSRYIFTEKYFRKDNSVKWQAFKPKNNETSVYRTSGLSENDIWNIGRDVEFLTGRSLEGRADIRTSSVLDVNLSVIETPPSAHANIVGWPDDYIEIVHLAQKLAEASQGYRI
jgi:hypothetical protein